jgi:hypothetical protein
LEKCPQFVDMSTNCPQRLLHQLIDKNGNDYN